MNVGGTIEKRAKITGKHPLDAFLDLAMDEDLETEFLIPPRNNPDDVETRVRQLTDPHAHISVSTD